MKKGIIAISCSMVGAVAGASAVDKMMSKKTLKQKKETDKYLTLFLMMNQWVKVKQEGKSIPEYLKGQGYNRIAIYGMSYAGETLYEELKDSGIEVVYGIDQNADHLYAEVEVVKPDADLKPVDAVIVTPVFFFGEIEEALTGRLDCPILSLEDILYEI